MEFDAIWRFFSFVFFIMAMIKCVLRSAWNREGRGEEGAEQTIQAADEVDEEVWSFKYVARGFNTRPHTQFFE